MGCVLRHMADWTVFGGTGLVFLTWACWSCWGVVVMYLCIRDSKRFDSVLFRLETVGMGRRVRVRSLMPWVRAWGLR